MLLAILSLALTPSDAAYSIVTKTRLVQPYDLSAMNDEFQKARLLEERDGIGTFEITYYPFHRQAVTANGNWLAEDRSMREYLKPRPAANWDPALQAEILSELKAAGIESEKLDDAALVQQVSNWALKRSTFNDQFGLWMVEFKSGVANVPADLDGAFQDNEPKGLDRAEIFDREVYGKGMVQNRTHGACTSTSTYMATILRAVGIPTRIIVTVPAFDANDREQAKMMAAAVRQHKVRRTILNGNEHNGFSNHIFNEVWVGHKWIRLNYNRLGQSILDPDYEGLMTHIFTANDISEIPFATTWGPRYGKGEGPKLSSVNPYQLMGVRDELAAGQMLDNPPVSELTQASVIRVSLRGDVNLPSWVHLSDGTDGVLWIKEWLADDDYHQLRSFVAEAAQSFTLCCSGRPDLKLSLTGESFSDGTGQVQGFGVHLTGTPVKGIKYEIQPVNTGHHHTWLVEPSVFWMTS